MEKRLVNKYKHVIFDEGTDDIQVPTPNTRELIIARDITLPNEPEDTPTVLINPFKSRDSPFYSINYINIKQTREHDTLGKAIKTLPGCVCLFGVHPASPLSRSKGFRIKLIGVYLIQVNDTNVVTKYDDTEA